MEKKDNRYGVLHLERHFVKQIGAEKLFEIFEYIGLEYYDYLLDKEYGHFFCHCPLFYDLDADDDLPDYRMVVTFDKSEPTVEMFRVDNPNGMYSE